MADLEWRYVPDGAVKHALDRASDASSRCGVYVVSSAFWMGTGSQREYETCAALQECRNCLRLLRRDGVASMAGARGGSHA